MLVAMMITATTSIQAMNKSSGTVEKNMQFAGSVPALVLTSNPIEANVELRQGRAIEPAAGAESPPTFTVTSKTLSTQMPIRYPRAQWRSNSIFSCVNMTGLNLQPAGANFSILKYPLTGIAPTTNPTDAEMLPVAQWRQFSSSNCFTDMPDDGHLTFNILIGRTLNAVSSDCVTLMMNAQMLSILEQMQISSLTLANHTSG